ncbi:MAG: hypothetical protein R3B52_00670 [Candidatus Paceibacterota bacterium]
MSFDAALRLLSTDEEGLEALIKERKIRVWREGGQMKFLQSDIDAYLAGKPTICVPTASIEGVDYFEQPSRLSFDEVLRKTGMEEEELLAAMRQEKVVYRMVGGRPTFTQEEVDAYVAEWGTGMPTASIEGVDYPENFSTEAAFNTVDDLPATGPQGKITLLAIHVAQDPKVTVYHVTVETPKATWTETLRTEGEVDTFLKGFQAALSMAAGDMSFRPPAIPGR